MKWSEVIMVRSTGSSTKILANTVQDLTADVARSSGNDDIRIFHRENIATDICVVLFHSGKKTQTGGSSLGLRIAAAFKEIGHVYHTIWNEASR
jgi:hypothetical protein